MSDGRARAKLFVCETCIRDQKIPAGELTLGQRLVRRLRELEVESTGCSLRVVSCLRGCLNPANVSLRASGKTGLRLSKVTPVDAPAIIRLLELYAASDGGEIMPQAWPTGLRAKLSAQIPATGPGAKKSGYFGL